MSGGLRDAHPAVIMATLKTEARRHSDVNLLVTSTRRPNN
jgi:hypothetical protein